MIIHDVVQGSGEWHELRIGKITSSRLKRAISDKYLELIDEMIAEIEVGVDDDDFVSDDMQRGLDLEPLAVIEYERITGVKTTVIGFVQSSELPILGHSPDRYVGKVGALEVKCPNTKNHIKYLRHDKLPTDYRPQVKTYFLCNPDLEWVDFMSYDPRLGKKPVFIKRVERGELQAELDSDWAKLINFNEKFEYYKDTLLF